MKTVNENKSNVCKELIPVFVEARKIAKENGDDGIGTIHVFVALEKIDSEFEKALKYSVLMEDEYKAFKDSALKSFSIKKGTQVSTELKSITISHGYDKYEFIKHLIKSKKISYILDEVYIQVEDVLKSYGKMSRYNGDIKESAQTEKVLQDDEVGIKEKEKEKTKSALVSLKSKRTELPKIPKELESLFVNVTDKASEGELFKVIGREEELLDLYKILKRHSKSNPIIVGESGVGKTTLVNALAREMIAGNAPSVLCEKHILEMNFASLMSDTKYQGDLEKKVTLMMKYIESCADNVILLIDNIHNILISQEGRLNVGELLKPFLSRSDFACIGISDMENYRKIEKNLSISRYFQKVEIEQPSVPETVSILRGLKVVFENHHKIEIDDSAIIQAVKMSDRYITDRFFPDKAIDIIDEAASIVKIAMDSKPVEIQSIENKIKQKRLEKHSVSLNDSEEASFQINNLNKELLILESSLKVLVEKEKRDLAIIAKIKEIQFNISDLEEKASLIDGIEEKMAFESEYLTFLKSDLESLKAIDLEVVSQKLTAIDVMKVIAKKTGVPVDKMKESDREKVLNLEKRLSEKLIGQDSAVNAVSRVVKRSMAGLSDLERPTGSFLFLGSSGVGKTELCKQLAFELFGNKESIVRIDMSEYQEKSSISTLIGSSKGYVDSDTGGVLTEAVRKKPYSIVLFDEIEKAHPDTWNIMLQMLDEGHLTDGSGRKINFKNTIIVLTSNIGSENMNKNTQKEKDKVMKELTKKMRPELINRIDEKIIFETLGKEELRKIARLVVKPTIEKMAEKRIELKITDECLDLIVSTSCDPRYGARPLKRAIKSKIDDLLADYLLIGYVEKGSSIVIDELSNRVQLVKEVDEK